MNVTHLVEDELWGQDYTGEKTVCWDETTQSKIYTSAVIPSHAFILKKSFSRSEINQQSTFNCGPVAVIQECLNMPASMGERL